jgi:hypothetical protein
MKFRQEEGRSDGYGWGGEGKRISKKEILCLYSSRTEFICNNKKKERSGLLFLHTMLWVCSVVLSFRFFAVVFVENSTGLEREEIESAITRLLLK